MQASDQTVLENLGSGDPTRIQAALRSLSEHMLKARIPPLGIELLDPFGGNVPEETLDHFLTITRHYSKFEPPLSERQKISILVAVVLRYGGKTHVTYDLQIDVKIAPNPAEAVAMAMEEIVTQSLGSPKSIAGAEYFVSCLLDGKSAVRKATLESLRTWPSDAPYTRVKEYVAPQLEPDELEFLQGA